ncbi:MAG: DNA gyrase/topoisomerase IV subunit A [Opitutales bacterium]|nr:DNA gyrase/topoisomerase IV subunit A [Opitutales bacterium]
MADDSKTPPPAKTSQVVHIDEMYGDWFLDYASYVILERAVPHINDGLKPVQRRILHSMREMEDGRYNKVANIVGNTMKYHPHGDASIGDALIQLGQKDLLIDAQGNWGNTLTGDSAAAPRYIEARLSKFALEVVFNPKTTEWALSYDGRNQEPVTQPVKFPLVLAQGVEGIAVGLSTRILPHNFLELIDASIAVLRNKPFEIFPDFPFGGIADFSDYQDGKRGGRVRVRARIEKVRKTLVKIIEIPYGTNTTSLIDSILAANDKNKIKISRVEDNTSENAEILVHLPSGSEPDTAIKGLYAFTDCEVSIAPNACVITEDAPAFLGVSDILKICAEQTKELLRRELEIRLGELREKWHFSSLEKIFIENRIYRDIEECETWEAVLQAIDTGLEPHKKKLLREVTEDDLIRLTEIKIKRISKFDSSKADELIRGLEEEIEEVENHLAHLTQYAVNWFKRLRKKYGEGRERRTEISTFDRIIASKVAIANETLYVNRKEGFAGYGMKKEEEVSKCSSIDDIIVFRGDGSMIVSKVQDKAFVGKNITHIEVFDKAAPTTYSMIYRDGKNGPYYAKKFQISGVTREKEYPLTKSKEAGKVLYFAANKDPNYNDQVTIYLHPSCSARKKKLVFDFADIDLKSRGAGGNIVTKYPVSRVSRLAKGVKSEPEEDGPQQDELPLDNKDS